MRIAIVVIFALTSACSTAAPALPAEREEFDGRRALNDVEVQVGFGARYPGSPGHAEVQRWIVGRLTEAGWRAEEQPLQYRGVPLKNIVASRTVGDGRFILLGAHYDTRRMADRDPERPTEPVPGANDGASGVAVLLELARVAPSRGLGCDLRLAFFDGEDNGGLDGWDWAVGSRHMAAGLDEPPRAVVVVDMVGDRDLDLPIERTSSPDLAEEIWSQAARLELPAFRGEPGPSVIDDHTPFLERGWRAVDIIDLSYPYWHTTQDTVDKVSAESLAQVGRALLAWLDVACPPAGR